MNARRPRSALSRRWSNPLAVGTAILLLVILGTNLIFLLNLRETTLQTAEVNLTRYSLTVAEQVDRSFKSLDLVLSSVGDYIGRRGVTDADSYRREMAGNETFLFLKEKITGLPQVDAVTMIDANGKLINFSRYWPIPKVDVSDRDYFKALKADPNLETYISKPVQNRGDGAWVIYLARRLNDPNGGFMGLILGAVSLKYFENFFGATSSGEGSIVALYRDDKMMLARFPHSDRVGQFGTGSPQRTLSAGGMLREMSMRDEISYLRAARMLANYPLILQVSQTEASALVGWRKMAELLIATSVVCSIVLLIAAFVSERLWRAQERAARAAEAASHAKSSFLAMMSHEIRTPMNAVLGLAGTLLESRLDADQRNSLVAIRDAGENLMVILNDILDFSKLEAGQLSLEKIAFSPVSLVDNVVSIFKARAVVKNVKMRTIEDPQVPAVMIGDAGRIRQIVLNLVSNAVKFTEAGEVTIAVRCLKRTADHAMIEWAITDTGIGIPPERIKDLFTEFTQADSSIGRRFGGSGLGLAICKRLVHQMGGEIEVTSVPGRGSIFRFHLLLPIADQAAPVEQDDQRLYGEFETRLDALGRPLRVLIAEDNPTNRLVAVKMLEHFNVQISLACDGIEAVAEASRIPFDIILMDVRMPETDGLQATRTLRERGGQLAQVPIIAFTANAFADDIRACRDAGMNDFIAKPVRKKQLIETMLRALMRRAPETDEPIIKVTAPPLAPVPASPPATTDNPAPIFERAAYDMLAEEIGDEGAREMLQIFVTETDARLKLLQQLSDLADRARIKDEAHSLKGAAATFGFVYLSQLARSLELAAAAISANDYRALLDRIEAGFAAARNYDPGLARIIAIDS